MKKSIICIAIMALVIQALSMAARTRPAVASDVIQDGSEEHPYIIMWPSDLSDIRNHLSDSVTNQHYKLGQDINLSGYDFGDGGGWKPIGDNSAQFPGILDGNGFVIRNMKIDRQSTSLTPSAGLFWGTKSTAQLIDIRLLDVEVKGYQKVSGLAGINAGLIKDSYVTGHVSAVVGGSEHIGGLVGFNVGTIQNSHSSAEVTGGDDVGGLVGLNGNGGSIQNSYATGTVSGGDDVGGLVGLHQHNVVGLGTAIIQNSYATGSVTGSDKVGGLVGEVAGDDIDSSYSTGHVAVTGGTDVGGLVGFLSSSPTITNSFWDTGTSGQTDSAGGPGYGDGEPTSAMQSLQTYTDAGLDFTNTWGIRDGESYPYLLAYKPEIAVNPLAATVYSLALGGDELSVTGTVYDDSIGEQVTIDYAVKNSSNVTVTSVTYSVYADGSAQSIDRAIDLTGLSDGAYTLHVTATDTYNSPVEAAVAPAFTIDSTPPSVTFGTNGSGGGATSASTTVTVTDSGSGVDASTLQYAWTADTSTPDSSAWTSFANGDSLSKSGADGDWYLHIRAKDTLGNTVSNAVSSPFQLDTSAAKLSGLSLSSGALDPAFAADTFAYTASVGNGVSGIAITPVDDDSSDTVTVGVYGGTPQTVASGTASGTLALAEGENTLEVAVTALNGSHNTYTVTVSREVSPESSSDDDRAPEPELAVDSTGGVKLAVDPSMIEKVTGPDGVVTERISLDEKTLDQALSLLQTAAVPLLTVEIDDTEQAVQVRLPAAAVGRMQAAVANAVIQVRLNGSSFQLVIGVLDLDSLAARLGAEPKDLKINIVLTRASEAVEGEAQTAAAADGFRLAGSVVGFELMVEANGRTVNIGDFGGTYMARAIVTDADAGSKNLVGALYDPAAKTFSFIPSHIGVREDGTQEMEMQAPHNSLYTVLETKRKTFADLNGHWARADIELLASKLIVQGVTDNRFAPNDDITRAEFAALLVRALGLVTEGMPAGSRFDDVSAGAWYAPAVETAATAGLVAGVDADRFAPNGNITREQMAVMIAKALTVAGKPADVKGAELSGFADRAEISAWARDSVARAVAADIISGMPDGTFAPKAFATRAEAAVVLKRFLQHVGFID